MRIINSRKPGEKFADVIFDIGANNGEDLEYYLMKAEKVIAVEANPLLCSLIEERYPEAITKGNLIVENLVITNEKEHTVDFYLHKTNPGLSQISQPNHASAANFNRTTLPAVNIVELIKRHTAGNQNPYYCKLDVEGFESPLLVALFAAGIYPQFLSAESHSAEVFSQIASCGKYQSYKLVEGNTVHSKYRNARIDTMHGERRYTFKAHSAGPFGEDILGGWYQVNDFFLKLSISGLGWKDIHVSQNEYSQYETMNCKRLAPLYLREFLKSVYQIFFSKSFRDKVWIFRSRF